MNISTDLYQALQLLASAYTEQTRALPDYICLADELALLYSDALLLPHDLNPTQTAKLHELDAQLEAMSQQIELWHDESLQNGAEWQAVRHLANEALQLLGLAKATPQLETVSFIPHSPTIIEAIFDGENFHPIQPFKLKPQSRVRLAVEVIAA